MAKSKKQETVMLTNQKGKQHEFVMEHALALLRLQAKTNRKGWVLNSKKWEFVGNEIAARTDSKQA